MSMLTAIGVSSYERSLTKNVACNNGAGGWTEKHVNAQIH